jgi:hypothetical protein
MLHKNAGQQSERKLARVGAARFTISSRSVYFFYYFMAYVISLLITLCPEWWLPGKSVPAATGPLVPEPVPGPK